MSTNTITQIWTPDDATEPPPRLRAWVWAPLLLAAAILSGLWTAPASHADGVISNTEAAYILAYGAAAVCPTIAEYPSTAGVMGVMQAIVDDGFAADSAIDIINASVSTYCDQYWPLLQRIGAAARGETVLKRAI